MDGRATFTTVMSRTIISMPVHSTTSAIQRERSFMVPPVSHPVTGKDGTRSGN